eukprot:3756890-Ditylum_brightwellii.AAC.1
MPPLMVFCYWQHCCILDVTTGCCNEVQGKPFMCVLINMLFTRTREEVVTCLGLFHFLVALLVISNEDDEAEDKDYEADTRTKTMLTLVTKLFQILWYHSPYSHLVLGQPILALLPV